MKLKNTNFVVEHNAETDSVTLESTDYALKLDREAFNFLKNLFEPKNKDSHLAEARAQMVTQQMLTASSTVTLGDVAADIKRNKKVDVPTEQWQKNIERHIKALQDMIENRCQCK